MTGFIRSNKFVGARVALPWMIVALALGGCGNDDGAAATGTDATQDTGGAIGDASAADGTATDTGSSTADVTAQDAAVSTDAVLADAGQKDAGTPDTGNTDAGAQDSWMQTDLTYIDSGAPDGGTADTGLTLTCAEMSKKLYHDLSTVVGANNSCKAGDECVIAQTDTACAGACGQAVNKSGLAAVNKVVADLDVNLCKANGYAGKCGYSTPSCAQPKPACEKGKCVYSGTEPTSPCGKPQPAGTICVGTSWVCMKGYFHAAPTAKGCMKATCQNMIAAHGELIGGVAAGIQKCSQDSECVVVSTSTACQGACGVAVNSAEAQVLKTSLAWADKNICKANGYAGLCGYSTPKCIAPNPGCKSGLCVYAK